MDDDVEANSFTKRLLCDDSPTDADSNIPNKTMQNNIVPSCTEASYYINETVWCSVSWELEMARKILSWSKHSLLIFDTTYLGLLTLEIVMNYSQWTSLHRAGGTPFVACFAVVFGFNVFAPPLGMHLIKSVILHPAVPVVFRQASNYDPKFHFRMHNLAHFNCAASLLAVLLSFFTNPLYRFVQLPFLVLYVIPLSFTLSFVVCLLEGHRLLACEFIEALEGEDVHTDQIPRNLSSSAHDSPLLSASSKRGIDVSTLRRKYFDLHLRFDLVRKHWGLHILFVILALLLITAGLVWYSYISDFNRVKFSLVLPYIIIALSGLCQIMFSLTMVNEVGAKVSRALAKHIFAYHGQSPYGSSDGTTGVSDVNNLLLLTQIVPVEVAFVQGFSLRVRLTAALVGPLVGSLLPKLVMGA